MLLFAIAMNKALQLAKKHRKDKMRAASGEQAKKRLLYTPPASGAITDYDELVQEETTVQYKEAIPYQESTVPAAKGSMTMQDVIYFLQTVGSSNIKVTGS